MKTPQNVVQGSLFEDDYLIRSLGNIVRDPDYALTELVANAWDAGATNVDIQIPKANNGIIRVIDNGHGLTSEEFKTRWMKLGYNRLKHQGPNVEFPPGESHKKRKAYGRNGIGRHGMLCFSDVYTVTSKKMGKLTTFKVKLSSGDHPFIIASEHSEASSGHGTTVETKVFRNNPDPDQIRESISARFIADPQFIISVNGKSLSLAVHPGAETPIILEIEGCGRVEVVIVDASKSGRTKQKQGFAFWVENRLVGEQSWNLGSTAPIDARTTFGRRFTVLVKCDCMESELEPDWSGFRKGNKRTQLFKALSELITAKYHEFSREKVDETKRVVFQENLDAIRPLNNAAQAEVVTFVEAVVEKEPTIRTETLSTAVQAVINLQQTRSGQRLLERLSILSGDDVEALDRILSEWSAQDALTVLEEIDHRISTVRAIEILSSKNDTDELHTLHPLVTEARWIFGPEYESSEYASNLSLKNAVNKVFKAESLPCNYPNWRKRPDLLLLADASISSVALDEIDSRSGLSQIRRVLLLELKKGDAKIGRKEMNQAEEYVDAIKNSESISSQFHIDAFVVGARVDSSVALNKDLRDSNAVYANIRGVCFSDLTETASRRLFRLKQRLEERYSEISGATRSKVLDELLSQQVLNL